MRRRCPSSSKICPQTWRSHYPCTYSRMFTRRLTTWQTSRRTLSRGSVHFWRRTSPSRKKVCSTKATPSSTSISSSREHAPTCYQSTATRLSLLLSSAAALELSTLSRAAFKKMMMSMHLTRVTTQIKKRTKKWILKNWSSGRIKIWSVPLRSNATSSKRLSFSPWVKVTSAAWKQSFLTIITNFSRERSTSFKRPYPSSCRWCSIATRC